MARYDLPDAAWALILPLLSPERSQRPGHPYIEHRKVINGMFWVLCSGAPWRDLPERYESWKTVYNRFNRWAKKGIIKFIFNKLLSILDEHKLLDWPAISLDGINIRAMRCAAGAQKNIPISLVIMAWVAHEAVMAPKSIWQQTETGYL